MRYLADVGADLKSVTTSLGVSVTRVGKETVVRKTSTNVIWITRVQATTRSV